MGFIIAIDIMVVCILVLVACRQGFERALPLAACLLVLFPEESKITIPGLFDLTTQRFILLALIVLCFTTGKRTKDGPRKLPLRAGILAWILWWGLAAANSVVPWVSVKTVLSEIFDFFVIYYIFCMYVSKTQTAKRVLFGIVTGLVACSVLGLLESYANWTVVSLFPRIVHRSGVSGSVYVDMSRGIRAQSTFGHPILLGSALAMTVPMALYLVSISRSTAQRWFLWSGILLMFACIYKTGSRGPWIALALSLGTLLVFNKARVRKYLVVIALLTVSVLVVRPGVGETIWNNYIATLDKNSTQGESYQYRYALYDLAVRELDRSVRRAIFGYGPESFYFLKITGEFNGRVMTFVSCDNSIAALLIETGYLGLLIAMSVLATALVRAYRKCRRVGPRANGIYLVLFVSMATFVFMMTNVAILGWGQENFIFWIVMALSMTYPRLAALEQKRKSETALARPPALVCVGESAQ